jgi:hypothetical protein
MTIFMNSQSQKTLIVRALELAPICESNKVLRKVLKREGYTLAQIQSHFEGKGFKHHLKALRKA